MKSAYPSAELSRAFDAWIEHIRGCQRCHFEIIPRDIIPHLCRRGKPLYEMWKARW